MLKKLRSLQLREMTANSAKLLPLSLVLARPKKEIRFGNVSNTSWSNAKRCRKTHVLRRSLKIATRKTATQQNKNASGDMSMHARQRSSKRNCSFSEQI